MKISSNVQGSDACLWCKRLGQGALIGSLLVINTTGIFKDHAVDGVAGASVIHPAVKLKLTSTPKRNNSEMIRVAEGQLLTIHLQGINSNDPKGLDPIKTQSLGLTLLDRSDNSSNLPEGASFVTSYGTGTLTWTPQLGDAERYDGRLLKFNLTNSHTFTSAQQEVVLRVQDNSRASFADTLPSLLTAPVGAQQTLDIIAKPGIIADTNSPAVDGKPHKLKIVLDHDTPLPKGAKLSKARLDSNGNWLSTLSWKPKANQHGLKGNLKFYAENADVDAGAATFMQPEYDLEYAVDGAAPTPSPTPAPPPAATSVSGVTVSSAAITGSGSAWTLTVHGQVQTNDKLPSGLKAQLKFGDGSTAISSDASSGVGSITVTNNGDWTYTGVIDPNFDVVSGYRNLPCNVMAKVTYKDVTVESSLLAVTGAGDPAANQCVDTPKCKTGGKWYVYQGGMSAMCM